MNKSNDLCDLVAPLRFGESDSVQDDQQRMHAGHQSDLLGLGRNLQLDIDGLAHGIETRTYHGCDVQHVTHIGAPAKDVTLTTHGARVAVDGSRADQGGNSLAVEQAQLGQLRGIGIHDLHDAGLGLGMGHAQPLALGHQHGLQLAAPHHQRGEFMLQFIGRRQGQGLLVAAGGLQQHGPEGQLGGHLAQLSVAGLIVARTQDLTLIRDGHVKTALGRIDPNVNGFTPDSSPVPSLTNPKCVRSTIRDTAEQRDHRSAPCTWKRARARRRLKLHNGEPTNSAVDPVTDGLTAEV